MIPKSDPSLFSRHRTKTVPKQPIFAALRLDKRGTHLALSLERLDALADNLPLRIGLSATQKPIELVANFLAGTTRPDTVVVQIGHQREVDIAIEVPKSELGPVTSHELWDEIYDRIAALVLGLPPNEIEKVMLRLEGTGAVLRGRFSDPHSRDMEWCDRRLLARIHRLTVGKLRKEIESVSAAQFMRWLLRWQHLTPETQLFGQRGTLEVLRQLQGYEAPANAWERQLLSRRIAGYDPKILDQLCFNGNIGWGRLSPGPSIVDDSLEASHRVAPTGAAPITFFIRDESDWMTARQQKIDLDRILSSTAKEVFGFLKERGASFFADILRGTRKPKEEIELGLWELVAAGLTTADGFDNLRALIDPKRRDLSNGRDGRPRYSAGRWSLLFPTAAENQQGRLEALCQVLLRRYGVVFREVLMRESNLPNWREILLTLRRLEDRGEVRGGRFAAGFLGEQFALPAAVESLRSTRAEPPTGETITISAADPLNLVGIVVPGAKVLAISSRFVTYRDGVALEASQPIDYAAIAQAG